MIAEENRKINLLARYTLLDDSTIDPVSMAEDQKCSSAAADENKYETFDVGAPKQTSHEEPKKRSTLLTVCPFILGEHAWSLHHQSAQMYRADRLGQPRNGCVVHGLSRITPVQHTLVKLLQLHLARLPDIV